MGNVRKLDKLTRSFLVGSSNPNIPFNQFNDIQDPTYMSFKLDFFPDGGYSNVGDACSSCGLFRAPDQFGARESMNFADSAYEYLGNIGAPTKQYYHKAFTSMLYRIQKDAPWYFQSVTGLSDLYRIDPANNFRGKDKVLTIDCLESVDMRMSYLADLYRNMVFDMNHMKEILPINLRTFNMNVHVLEFRRFNTTFGIIANAMDNAQRNIVSDEIQKETLIKTARNVFANNLGAGLFNNFNDIGNQLLNTFGGIGGLFGSGNGDENSNIKSAFEAVTVHTFSLSECEFDFFESPPYLDSVSVADNSTPSTFKFKIKVGKIEKQSKYPFHQFVIAEHIENTMLSSKYLESFISESVPVGQFSYLTSGVTSSPYSERYSPDIILDDRKVSLFRDERESVYPTTDGYSPNGADSEAYVETETANNYLKQKPLEKLLGGILQNATNYVNQQLNDKLGEMTGGMIGNTPLGNVYGKNALITRLRNSLSSFMAGDQSTNTDNTIPAPFTRQVILQKPEPSSPFVVHNELEKPPSANPWKDSNVYESESEVTGVHKQNQNENVYE